MGLIVLLRAFDRGGLALFVNAKFGNEETLIADSTAMAWPFLRRPNCSQRLGGSPLRQKPDAERPPLIGV